MPRAALLFLTLLLMSVPAAFAQEASSGPVELDHVILAINDLQRGIRDFTTLTGVTPQLGGERPGIHNALVDLGARRYLEIVAPVSTHPDSTLTALLAMKHLTPFHWVLRTRDIAGLVALLRAKGFAVSNPKPGSRVRPDGTVLSWQLARLEESTLNVAPFFIEWSAASPHPSSTSPTGCQLSDLHLVERGAGRLSLLVSTLGFRAHVDAGPNPHMSVSLVCSRGVVSFGE
jgi:hypothetical protein